MDWKKNLVLATLGILLLSLALPLVTIVRAQAEVMKTDRPLYAIKWSDNAVGYVNVTVFLEGLDPQITYKVYVSKFMGPEGLVYVGMSYGLSSATIKFVIPPTKDFSPDVIAGTWNATLYKVLADGTERLITYINFGVWAINSRVLNYGRILKVWGGGAKPGTMVNFSIYNATHYITSILFGEDPARCKASSIGTWTNQSVSIPTTVAEGNYTIEITGWTPLPRVNALYPAETTLTFRITKELLVKIIRPADGSTWRRTETVPVEVEVLYQDMVPVTTGEVKVTFTPPTAYAGLPGGVGKPKTISLTYDPAIKRWVGSFKIQYNNVTGSWDVTAVAKDYYGNEGTDSVTITVKTAILTVTTVTPPPASVARATWATWVIDVTYHGDGSPVDLDIPKCTVYVVNATTKEIVGSAQMAKIAAGRYNVTWFVPPEAKLGEYQFLIKAWNLYDKVDVYEGPNRGPKEDVYSPVFVVGITKLIVVPETYKVKYNTATVQKAFIPGSMVYIGASITYVESGVPMTMGSARAYIYNMTGHLIAEVHMIYHSDTRMWWGEWNSTGYPAGRYDVIVKARDIGYNVGEGATFFYISGLTISPAKGTVPPIENTKCEKLKDGNWLITATVYVDPATGKSLGTTITVTGAYFTPNSKVNVTVDWLPYPDVKAAIAVGKKALLAMNLPTDAEGKFSTLIVFPTTIKGTYVITARDAKGLVMTAKFEVVPGMILTPDPVVGSALIRVIATGLPANIITADSSSLDLLVNGMDAMTMLAHQVFTRWNSDANGTLCSIPMISGATYAVKPSFVIPFTEPGAYTFTLCMKGGTYYKEGSFLTAGLLSTSDSVKVVNAFKELSGIISDVKAIKESIAGLNAAITEVKEGIATIRTDIGEMKVSVEALLEALSDLNASIAEVKDGIASIKTDVGTIEAKIEDVVKALSDLNAMVTDVKSGVATIKTDVGTIKASVDALKSTLDAVNAKVTTVSGDVATIKTDVGEIKTKVGLLDEIRTKVDTAAAAASDAKTAATTASGAASALMTPVWVAVVLSLVAAIASIVAIIQVSRKIAG